ncbi:MAG: leucyl aminopeptidase family protein [Gammaproteobacteria bacterium]|nr:leucyl aminopeptidase family protein [Gammaproteobacteria bacterium]
MLMPVAHLFPFDQSKTKIAIPLIVIDQDHFNLWCETQSPAIQQWLIANAFKAEAGQMLALPDPQQGLKALLFAIDPTDSLYCLGDLNDRLNDGLYSIEDPYHLLNLESACLGFALGTYRFQHFVAERKKKSVQLKITPSLYKKLEPHINALFWIRDLINLPAESLGPTQLALEAQELAKVYQAECKIIVGTALLEQGYPLIHTVGRASDEAPRLVELNWGNTMHPKISLIGKGVCFDTGGLNIKGMDGMSTMKKDMGGAAHALGLARLIMENQLPVRLQVLIPIVENAINGHAYRPGDIFISRKGLSVEIGNTDAEGRLILADALTKASESNPELMIDFATLTGAARIAMGHTIAALFCNDDNVAAGLLTASEKTLDPIWRMPLFAGYKKMIRGKFADLNNAPNHSYGAAITAALFLECFVGKNIPWAHFDLNAWNASAQSGRPEGGEAMAIRAVFTYLEARYAE